MEYKFYITGSHGYLVVKHKELEELGIATKISPFSYKMGNKVYLEEDCDAYMFMNTYKATQRDPMIIDWIHKEIPKDKMTRYDKGVA